MVDTDGRIRWRTGLFETAWRVETVRWSGVTTLYTRVGDLFVYGCLLMLVAVALGTMVGPRSMSMDGRQPI